MQTSSLLPDPSLLDHANADTGITCHPTGHPFSINDALFNQLPNTSKDMRALESKIHIWRPSLLACLGLSIRRREWIFHTDIQALETLSVIFLGRGAETCLCYLLSPL